MLISRCAPGSGSSTGRAGLCGKVNNKSSGSYSWKVSSVNVTGPLVTEPARSVETTT